jgi:hypothetical protein
MAAKKSFAFLHSCPTHDLEDKILSQMFLSLVANTGFSHWNWLVENILFFSIFLSIFLSNL